MSVQAVAVYTREPPVDMSFVRERQSADFVLRRIRVCAVAANIAGHLILKLCARLLSVFDGIIFDQFQPEAGVEVSMAGAAVGDGMYLRNHLHLIFMASGAGAESLFIVDPGRFTY